MLKPNIDIVRETIAVILRRYPAVSPHLSNKARFLIYSSSGARAFAVPIQPKDEYGVVTVDWITTEYKTVEYFLNELTRMVNNVYNGNLGGQFIDIMASLIQGQLTQAFQQAWDEEGTGGGMPEYLTGPLEDMILGQFEHVDQYYMDIVDARVDGTSVDPLVSRAGQWAHQWEVAYEEALRLIRMQNGGNFVWRQGETERGCSTCSRLDGIVMSAREWDELQLHPRGYPNPLLECQGGGPANNCDCSLEPTEQRRSPNAFNTVLDIVGR